MAVGTNDWLVDDSEDESEFNQLPRDLGPSASNATHSVNVTASHAAIQTHTASLNHFGTSERARWSPGESLFTPPAAQTLDTTIDNFTDVPSASSAPTAPPPRPRPRPRVVMKKNPPSDHNADVASTSFSHISNPPSATRQTNDSIQPATTASLVLSEDVYDAYSSFDIAERAKMRSRKSQATKKPAACPYEMLDVIELTSDEDELALKPKKRQKKQASAAPKPRPRPKPRQKVKQPTVLPSDSPPGLGPLALPARSVFSEIPPSTLPTIPPSTPPPARDPTPPSSPPVATRKRKRTQPLFADDNDEDVIGVNPVSASPSSNEPPPPFFAPSSSSVPTDSGVEIRPVESFGVRGKRAKSTKKGTQKKQDKGKKTDKVPSTPATRHSPSFAEEYHSPIVENTVQISSDMAKQRTVRKGGQPGVVGYHGNDEMNVPSKTNQADTMPAGEEGEGSKEQQSKHTSTPDCKARYSSIKPKSTPMSELIQRVNSHPSSPFPHATRPYSPYLKSSRTMLSKIAPLHPNRRSPPPPPPRPPPPKKSKKQLEMEEKIEEELAETIEGWSCLTDEERRVLRKARIDAELGYEY